MLIKFVLLLFALITFQVQAQENIELVCECKTIEAMMGAESTKFDCIWESENLKIDVANKLIFFDYKMKETVFPITEINKTKFESVKTEQNSQSYLGYHIIIDRYTGDLRASWTSIEYNDDNTGVSSSQMMTTNYNCKKGTQQLF